MAVASMLVLGCGGGGASVGEDCATLADCASGLQCLDHTCRPGCLANIDCGDGRICEDHVCRLVESAIGDACASEWACGPAQTCRLPPTFVANVGTCQADPGAGAVVGEACMADTDCRVGACALGRCTELCTDSSECLRGFLCTGIPRVSPDASAALGSFRGCLPSRANLVFDIPLRAVTNQTVVVPVVDSATSMVLVATSEDATDEVGVTRVVDPENRVVFTNDPAQYFTAPLRHRPQLGVAVLQIPSTTAVVLEAGVYTFDVVGPGPGRGALDGHRLRIIEKLGRGATLDLHFHFADLADHPCLPDEAVLDANAAASDPAFQTEFLGGLRAIFGPANIALGSVTYEPTDAPVELAGLPTERSGELFATSKHPDGISVFLVRTLSPAGLEAWVGGTPGAPLPGTGASGIAISMAALCHDPSWEHLARVTAHALSRHLGLYRNREPDPETALDPLVDSPTSEDNLMYWGENGGTALSFEQREILRQSPVLR